MISELKLWNLRPFIDENNLHVYKIPGTDSVFVTKVGNAPFAEEIKDHINGDVIKFKRTLKGAELHITKMGDADYFITEYSTDHIDRLDEQIDEIGGDSFR
jgi:hypothetical protein